jgi:23S rRNA (adenine2503-C2)-methyltransferase
VTESAPLPALTDFALSDYERLTEVPGARSFTPKQVQRWVLARRVHDFEEMSDLSKGLRAELAARYRVRSGVLERSHESRDGTAGLVTRLSDGQIIESVLIPEADRNTLCISSQVGCAVRCAFCASGLDGVIRNLSLGEIIEQVLVAQAFRPEQPLTNYVFMGSGEPTHNLKTVLAAIEIMNHPDGLGIGARRITVSTIGHPAALERLAAVPIAFNLALSIHMPTDAGRDALMPGLGSSDLVATLAAARKRFDATGRRITAEVVVLKGVNDRDEDAAAFARLFAGSPIAVNLIPWNPVDDVDLHPPDPERVRSLLEILRGAGITATARRPRGQDVGVACGQLRRRAQASS